MMESVKSDDKWHDVKKTNMNYPPQFYKASGSAVNPGSLWVLETRAAFQTMSGSENKPREGGNDYDAVIML